jgi:hypothetical protein
MLKKTLVLCALTVLLATPAFAQEPRIEVGALFGYTLSEGVPVTASANGIAYTDVGPASGMAFGLTFGVNLTPNTEVEFLWARQSSQLNVNGTGPTLSGDMNIDTYHGNFIYNFGDSEAIARPFILVGIGATAYSDVLFPTKTVTGLTRFSWALGGGVKVYPAKHVGVRAMARWTPTYIKTDGYGWWCDPFWGCVAAGNAQYSNQFEMSGGVVLRF